MEKKRVVGISYEPAAGEAPVVVLKGSGEAADAVLDAAQAREDLPVVRDPTLVEQLYRVPIDASVGKELFPVMAVLLAHVLYVDRKTLEEKP